MKISDILSKVGRMDHTGHGAMEQLVEALREKGYPIDNLYQELEMESCYMDTYEDVSYGGDQVQLHSHNFYELLYCTSGSVQYLLGPNRYRVQRGDVVLIPPGVGHRPLIPDEMEIPYRRYVLWFNTEFAKTIVAQWSEGAVAGPHSEAALLHAAGTRWEYIGELFRQGYQESAAKKPGWQACLYGNGLQILVHLVRAMQESQGCAPIPEQHELLDDVLGYVETHLAEKITLESTARRFLVSESTISQTFRKKVNVSFYRCVTQRRLIAAKALITDGLPLESIGEQVGFADYSTFYRAFKREYGISPRQFRTLQTMQPPVEP